MGAQDEMKRESDIRDGAVAEAQQKAQQEKMQLYEKIASFEEKVDTLKKREAGLVTAQEETKRASDMRDGAAVEAQQKAQQEKMQLCEKIESLEEKVDTLK